MSHRYEVVCNKTSETLLRTDDLGKAHGAACGSKYGGTVHDHVGVDGSPELRQEGDDRVRMFAMSEIGLDAIEKALAGAGNAYARGFVIAARKNGPLP